jgi:hypothetical protein
MLFNNLLYLINIDMYIYIPGRQMSNGHFMSIGSNGPLHAGHYPLPIYP